MQKKKTFCGTLSFGQMIFSLRAAAERASISTNREIPLTTTGKDSITPPFLLPNVLINRPAIADPKMAPNEGKLPNSASSGFVMGADKGVVVFEAYSSEVYEGHTLRAPMTSEPKPTEKTNLKNKHIDVRTSSVYSSVKKKSYIEMNELNTPRKYS